MRSYKTARKEKGTSTQKTFLDENLLKRFNKLDYYFEHLIPFPKFV